MTEGQLPRLVLKSTLPPQQPAFDDEVLAQLLEEMHNLIARYPYVARTLAAAFVAEGRRFAETPEGHEWYITLSQSELIRRGQLIWEAYGLDNLVESEPEHLPTIWSDTFATASAHTDLESILSLLLVRGIRDASFRT